MLKRRTKHPLLLILALAVSPIAVMLPGTAKDWATPIIPPIDQGTLAASPSDHSTQAPSPTFQETGITPPSLQEIPIAPALPQATPGPVLVTSPVASPNASPVATPAASPVATPNEPAAICQTIFAPSYYWLDENFFPQWEALIQANTVNNMIIVVNPPSVPDHPDPEHQQVIQMARQNNITVLGYVQTLFGERSVDEMITRIDYLHEWYELDGIFIDEVIPSDANLGYFQAIVDASREEPGQLVVLNPGGTASRDYIDMVDMIVTFEGSYERYVEYELPEFMREYPPERFVHLVHTTPSDRFEHALELSQDRNVSWIYVTDDVLPNAFRLLPSYWSEQVDAVNGTC